MKTAPLLSTIHYILYTIYERGMSSLQTYLLIFIRMCFANGTHVQKTCPEGQIIYINVVTHDWMCGIDDGRCPGAFQVGCDPDPDYSTVPPPPPVNFCNKTKNPLGECCGNKQLWISDGCTTVSFKWGYFTTFNAI